MGESEEAGEEEEKLVNGEIGRRRRRESSRWVDEKEMGEEG